MLGYRVFQTFHPSRQIITPMDRGGHDPVFTTSQLVQPIEEEEEEFDFNSNTSEEGSAFSPNEEFFHATAQTENQAIELLSLLTLCAESISMENHAAINCFLSRLGELASPRGSTIQRLVAYFAEGLALRAVKLFPHIFSISPPRDISDEIDYEDDCIALRILNQVSPIQKFIHFTINERLLKAFEGKDRVHIIDFDMKEGFQWPSLLQSLASRPHPPTQVRITGIGDSRQDLQETGNRLKHIAESLHLQFEFHCVVDRLEDVRLWMLHVKEGECVGVNCISQLHKTLYSENQSGLMNLLALIRSTNPSILLVAEEEAEHNDPRWEVRFGNALKYYSSLFDSLDANFLHEDSILRLKVEEMFGRRIRNVVSCEGDERMERHERFEKWRQMIEGCGFKSLELDENEEMQSRLILKMYSSGEDYDVKKEEGGLKMKWFDQALYTVSAWEMSS